jgi:hypothetical protein
VPHKLNELLEVSELANIIIGAIDEWKETEGNPFKLKQEVFKKLNAARDEVLLDSVGLAKGHRGKFEVREGSAIQDYVNLSADNVVKAWIKEQIGETVELSDEEKAQVQKIFRDEYITKLKENIKAAASAKARDDSEDLREIIGSSICELKTTAKELLKASEKEIEEKPKIKFRVFNTRGTLSSVEFICPVYIDGDKISSVDIASPTKQDVWFLVRIKSSINHAAAYIVTDCKEYLPCAVRLNPGENGTVWVHEADSKIMEEFSSNHAIFNLMNEQDMNRIKEAVNESV